MQDVNHIEVDGTQFQVTFDTEWSSLNVTTEGGQVVTLPVWRFREFLGALSPALLASKQGISLDGASLIAAYFDWCAIPQSLQTELMPLALWWVCSGSELFIDSEVKPALAGEFLLMGKCYPLSCWSARERMDALSQSVENPQQPTLAFNLVNYLQLMIKASVQPCMSDEQIETLESAAVIRLLGAVIAHNVSGSFEQEAAAWGCVAGLKQVAESTLRLCRILGCTPSTVWNMPANEVDMLLQMADVVDGPAVQTSAAAQRTGLAADPNVFIIKIEDD